MTGTSKLLPTLLNTRPKKQAESLTQLIQGRGIKVVECPSMEIQQTAFPKALLSEITQFDTVFFISANAVNTLNQLWHDRCNRNLKLPDQLSCYAIGKSTQKALKELGIDSSTSAGSFDSVSLLATLPQMNTSKCLIVKGEEGLVTLAHGLRAKGANVTEWPIYRRIAAPFCKDNWQVFKQSKWPIFLFSSYQAFQLLIEQIERYDPVSKNWSLRQDAIVFSERIKKSLTELGWEGTVRVVSEQSNAGILECLTQFSDDSR